MSYWQVLLACEDSPRSPTTWIGSYISHSKHWETAYKLLILRWKHVVEVSMSILYHYIRTPKFRNINIYCSICFYWLFDAIEVQETSNITLKTPTNTTGRGLPCIRLGVLVGPKNVKICRPKSNMFAPCFMKKLSCYPVIFNIQSDRNKILDF